MSALLEMNQECIVSASVDRSAGGHQNGPNGCIHITWNAIIRLVSLTKVDCESLAMCIISASVKGGAGGH
jgi:hypothetical protein